MTVTTPGSREPGFTLSGAPGPLSWSGRVLADESQSTHGVRLIVLIQKGVLTWCSCAQQHKCSLAQKHKRACAGMDGCTRLNQSLMECAQWHGCTKPQQHKRASAKLSDCTKVQHGSAGVHNHVSCNPAQGHKRTDAGTSACTSVHERLWHMCTIRAVHTCTRADVLLGKRAALMCRRAVLQTRCPANLHQGKVAKVHKTTE